MDVVGTLAMQLAWDALRRVIADRKRSSGLTPSEEVTVQMALSDGRTLVLSDFQAEGANALQLQSHGSPSGEVRLLLHDGVVLSPGELAQFAAAALNEADNRQDTSGPADVLELHTEAVPQPVLAAYFNSLRREFPWVESGELELASEFFALRDNSSAVSADLEWNELEDEAQLLGAFASPPALVHPT